MKINLLILILIFASSVSCVLPDRNKISKESLSIHDSTKSINKPDSITQFIDEINLKRNAQLKNLINIKWAKYQPDTIKRISKTSYFHNYAFQNEISNMRYLAFNGRIEDITNKGIDTVLLLLSLSRQDVSFQISITRVNFNKIISPNEYTPLSRRIFVLVNNIQIKSDLVKVEGNYQYNTIINCDCIDLVPEE